MAGHCLIWLALLAPYCAYNRWAGGAWLPTTFAAKAMAQHPFPLPFPGLMPTTGLAGALARKDPSDVVRCLTVGPLILALSTIFILATNNVMLTWRLPRVIRQVCRGQLGPAGLLAVLGLLVMPLTRGIIDPGGHAGYQFQRYFGHLTALLIVLVLGTWHFQNHRGRLSASMVTLLVGLSLVGAVPRLLMAAMGVQNITAMQVRIGRWIEQHTRPDDLITTNDVGAIAFYGRRPVLDTVGLTEPPLARHYLAGGTLEQYLETRRPQYACLFPHWHDGLARRTDLFELIFDVSLSFNSVCGDETMWVLRTRWNPRFGQSHPASAP